MQNGAVFWMNPDNGPSAGSDGDTDAVLAQLTLPTAGAGGQMHFEIAYNGLSRDSTGTHYHLIYKEYRAENPDQPIHMRDLAFKTDQRQVEVAGIDLQVDEVSESRILYTVVGE